MSQKRLIFAAMLGAAAVLCTPVARAGPREQAAALFRQGIAQMDSRQYGAALGTFEEAYLLWPSYRIDYNIALTLEYLGRGAEAAERFERFLVKGRAEAPLENVKMARDALAALSARLGCLRVPLQDEPALVAIDGERRGNAGLPWPFYLEPGPHRVEVTVKGRPPFRTQVVTVAGQERTLEVPGRPPSPAEPMAVGEPADPPPDTAPMVPAAESTPSVPAPGGDENEARRRAHTIGGVAAIGMGVVCVGVASGFYASVDSQDGDEDLATAGHVFVGVGAVAVVFGLISLATRPDRKPAQQTAWTRLNAGVSPSAGGASLILGGRF